MRIPLDKVYSAVTLGIRLTLLVAVIGAYAASAWPVLFITCFVLLLTFVPDLLKRRAAFRLPVEFELAMIVFVYASLFLGDVRGYYAKFWFWDIVLHSGSAIAFGITGFLIMYVLLEGKKVTASPILTALFAFSFALAIGALWEVIEFGVDHSFGTNMQKSGLMDTMGDLITDACGALLASVAGYFYLKGKRPFGFEKAVQRFVQENPKVFED